MSYGTTEARVQSLLQGLTSVFTQAAHVTRGDWLVLDSGADAVAVLFPGEFSEGAMVREASSFQWTVNIDLFVRFTNTAWSDFTTKRDAILQHLQKYPTLNFLTNANRNAMSGGVVSEVYDKDSNGPFFLTQTIALRVDDYVQVTCAE
jgi:hypothetical protein